MSPTTALAAADTTLPGRLRHFTGRNLTFVITASILTAIALSVIVLPFFLPSVSATDPLDRLKAPSLNHVLGTDSYGRDVFARLMTGGRLSLGLAALITVSAAASGMVIGLISGFFKTADAVLMRIMDAWMAFPAIILAMALAIALGASMWTELIALTVIFTPFTARVIRSRVLTVSARAYIGAAKVSGMRPWKTLLVHVFPNVLPLALVQVVILSASAMLVDGAMSFLGLGIAPPTPTWGNMIAEGRSYMSTAPWLILAPGLSIIVCVVLLNLAGSSLRSFVDPRSRALQDLQRLRARKPEPVTST